MESFSISVTTSTKASPIILSLLRRGERKMKGKVISKTRSTLTRSLGKD